MARLEDQECEEREEHYANCSDMETFQRVLYTVQKY